MDAALDTIHQLATAQETLTADDVWHAVEYPPREPRMIGNAMRRAQLAGLIEATDQHQRSAWSMNHKRPVRVWRSLHRSRQRLC